jgi:hypothetical protein
MRNGKKKARRERERGRGREINTQGGQEEEEEEELGPEDGIISHHCPLRSVPPFARA